MPASKTETGIYIELSRLRPIKDARQHRPEKIASLAKSLKESAQQLQDIVACPDNEPSGQASETFTILAGAGRWEAEKSLGWEKGRCTLLYGLTPFEKLRVTLDENSEREETRPLDDAKLYKAMLETQPNGTQTDLAAALGITRAALSQYLSLLDLDPAVQEKLNRFNNLGIAHLLQIIRLPTADIQLELAGKADQEGWSVAKLTAEVKRRLDKPGSPRNGKAPSPDPLASTWASLRSSDAPRGWKVIYRKKEWSFVVQQPAFPTKTALAEWFLKMGERLKGTGDGQTAERDAAPSGPIVSSGEDEPPVRLPNTPAEEAELESIAAAQGPSALNAWIFGKSHPSTLALAGRSWEDLGCTPAEGVRQMVDSLRSAVSQSAPVPGERVPAAPAKS